MARAGRKGAADGVGLCAGAFPPVRTFPVCDLPNPHLPDSACPGRFAGAAGQARAQAACASAGMPRLCGFSRQCARPVLCRIEIPRYRAGSSASGAHR